MAGPLQVGDIINLGKIAWDVYRFGWSDDLNATRQYHEFFNDVRGLAQNLDTLSRVFVQATSSLQSQGAYNAVARWHPQSLQQIIGDYHNTLRECHELINKNWRYRDGSSAIRNIEWNVLVQPLADALRQRILLHNSKVAQVLKPFEIDLMCRVREDIRNMHEDLANRMTAMQRDIHQMHRSMGITVPDLDQELNDQAQRRSFLLEVPMDIAERFRWTALTERPEFSSDEVIPLEDLSDAFTFNYLRSTQDFQGGLIVSDCVPPLDKYLNLLKCIWLFQRLKDATSTQDVEADSHWPSYVRRLEDDLSSECRRFGTKLVKPELTSVALRGNLFTIWPEREPPPLVDVVTKDEMMEQLLEVKLQSSTASVQQNAKLLRRLGSDGRKFRVMISGIEQTGAGRPRQQTETIDFDVTTATLNPQYALPYGQGFIREIILRRDEKIARMAFSNMPDLLKFQQAVTGFKVWASYTQKVRVGFVISGRKDHIHEEACLQLWIPKAMDGSLVTNSDAAADANKTRSPSRSGSMATSPGSFSPTSPSVRRDSFPMSNPFGISGETLTSPMGRQPSLPTIPQRQTPDPGVFSTSWPRVASPNPMSSSPPRQGFMSMGAPPRGPVARKPVGQPPSPRRSSTLATTISNTTNGSMFGRTERTYSVSSAVSTTAVSTGSSSNSDGYSVVSTGTHTTSILHKRPPKPMLVLFTINPKDNQLSFVTIQIDEETNVNPDICNCRRSGREGANCPDVGIERRKGDANLEARRYESPRGNELDWNLAQLALNNPTSTSSKHTWPYLKRVTITFPNARERAVFGGTPSICKCKIKDKRSLDNCLRSGHRGYWGEVQEHYRKRGIEYHERRHGSKKHVVDRLIN